MVNREDLIDRYSTRVVDGMDMDDWYELAIYALRRALDTYSDEELEAEVRDFYPDLLEN